MFAIGPDYIHFSFGTLSIALNLQMNSNSTKIIYLASCHAICTQSLRKCISINPNLTHFMQLNRRFISIINSMAQCDNTLYVYLFVWCKMITPATEIHIASKRSKIVRMYRVHTNKCLMIWIHIFKSHMCRCNHAKS